MSSPKTIVGIGGNVIKHEYLGDGVYLFLNHFGQIVIATFNGQTASNAIIINDTNHTEIPNIVKRWESELRNPAPETSEAPQGSKPSD